MDLATIDKKQEEYRQGIKQLEMQILRLQGAVAALAELREPLLSSAQNTEMDQSDRMIHEAAHR